MTSIPSPFDALRALLPLPGRGGPDGGPFGPLGDLPDLDDGPPRGPGQHARHGDGPAGPAGPGGAFRADGQAPLSPSEAHQIADTLTDAMRQNPSHPLFRDLPQTSPEVFRQWVVDVLTSPQSLMQGLPRETVHSLAQATSAAAALLREPGPSPAMAQARAEGDAMRASIQARADSQVQHGALMSAERAQPLARGDELRGPAPILQGAPDARGPTDPRSTTLLAQALAPPPRADAPVPAGAWTATRWSTGVPQQAHTTQPPIPQGHAAAAPADGAGRTVEMPAPLAQTRMPEGALPARAERAGDAAPPAGLPGLAGAAGVTLAAVSQPAGTTFAHAPQDAVRARTPAERRADRDGEAQDEAPGDAEARDGDGQRERRQRRDAARPGAAGDSPASGEAAAVSPQTPAAAAGHTALAGARSVSDDREETAAHASAAGHTAVGGERTSAQQAESVLTGQWLYWSLIAVTYGCLGSALALMSPWAPSLPIAPDALPIWRNGLTIAGLASGIWAWVVARRMR